MNKKIIEYHIKWFINKERSCWVAWTTAIGLGLKANQIIYGYQMESFEKKLLCSKWNAKVQKEMKTIEGNSWNVWVERGWSELITCATWSRKWFNRRDSGAEQFVSGRAEKPCDNLRSTTSHITLWLCICRKWNFFLRLFPAKHKRKFDRHKY